MDHTFDPVEYARLRENVRHLDRAVLEKPSLEDRMRKYADDGDEHKDRGMRQLAVDLKGEIDRVEDVQDNRHAANTKELSEIKKMLYIGVGIIVTLQALGLGAAVVTLVSRHP